MNDKRKVIGCKECGRPFDVPRESKRRVCPRCLEFAPDNWRKPTKKTNRRNEKGKT